MCLCHPWDKTMTRYRQTLSLWGKQSKTSMMWQSVANLGAYTVMTTEHCYSNHDVDCVRCVYSWGAFSLRWRHNGHDGISNHQPHHCLLNLLFGCWSKKTSKLRGSGLCVGNSPGTGEFPAQMVSNAENVSIWWRHHIIYRGVSASEYGVKSTCNLYVLRNIFNTTKFQGLEKVDNASCLAIPNHHPSQCWLTINGALWYSFCLNAQNINSHAVLEMYRGTMNQSWK